LVFGADEWVIHCDGAKEVGRGGGKGHVSPKVGIPLPQFF
jgi:hypothetical protein